MARTSSLRRFKPTVMQAREANRMMAVLAGKPDVLEPAYAALIKERKPRAKKKSINPSEHQIQAAVIQWWARAHQHYGLPEFALAAVPNGGARDAITGSILKAEGTRRGFPDLNLPVARSPFHGLYIEMKTPTGIVSDSQKDWLEYLNQAGYKTAVCKSVDSAILVIRTYLESPEQRQQEALI